MSRLKTLPVVEGQYRAKRVNKKVKALSHGNGVKLVK
jgi:hypothetical protein